MNSIAFRTVFGGPHAEVVEATRRITRQLSDVTLTYNLDIFLYLAGDISSTEKTTGLHAPRVSLAKQTMTAQIHIRRDDLKSADDLKGFLEETIYQALHEMITRIATKDASVDAGAETAKIDAVRNRALSA